MTAKIHLVCKCHTPLIKKVRYLLGLIVRHWLEHFGKIIESGRTLKRKTRLVWIRRTPLIQKVRYLLRLIARHWIEHRDKIIAKFTLFGYVARL